MPVRIRPYQFKPCTQIQACQNIYICTCVCIYIYIHTHTHAHVNIWVRLTHCVCLAGYSKYESNMRHSAVVGGHSACANWGRHPIDCLREAYHNKLQGTKFASLQRKYDGRVSEEDLNRERKLINKEIAQGLITGQVSEHHAMP